jgi:hypothetical protein
MQSQSGRPRSPSTDMNAHEAQRQIAEIRQRMAEGQVFRGFRAMAVAVSGVVALAGAGVQERWVSAPMEELGRYLALWFGVAGVSVAAAGVGLWLWSRSSGVGLARERAVLAAELVLPALVVGGLLTLCIVRAAPEVAWMLPGVWALVYSLAVLAARRILSPQVLWVAAWYLVSGAACLGLARGEAALGPWQMALCFGGGQLLGAAILFWTVERGDGERA